MQPNQLLAVPHTAGTQETPLPTARTAQAGGLLAIPPRLDGQAWRGPPTSPPGRGGGALLIGPLVGQVDKLLAARLARRRRDEDHRETIRACGHPMQKSTIGRVHADRHRDDSRLSETPEPSIVAGVPLALPKDDFNHARRTEYASARVGHDIPQTSSTTEEAMALAAGPPPPDGVHPEGGLISRHRRKVLTHILHPHLLCDARTPAVLRLFLSTGHNPLSP